MNNPRDGVIMPTKPAKSKRGTQAARRAHLNRAVLYGVGGAFVLLAIEGLVAEKLLGVVPSTPFDVGIAGIGFIIGFVATFFIDP